MCLLQRLFVIEKVWGQTAGRYQIFARFKVDIIFTDLSSSSFLRVP